MTPRKHMGLAIAYATMAGLGEKDQLERGASEDLGCSADHAFRTLEICAARLQLAMAMGRAACERIEQLEAENARLREIAGIPSY